MENESNFHTTCHVRFLSGTSWEKPGEGKKKKTTFLLFVSSQLKPQTSALSLWWRSLYWSLERSRVSITLLRRMLRRRIWVSSWSIFSSRVPDPPPFLQYAPTGPVMKYTAMMKHSGSTAFSGSPSNFCRMYRQERAKRVTRASQKNRPNTAWRM